jgi:hypothetical protein
MNLLACSQIVAASILGMASLPGYAAPKLDDPLALYRGKARVLVAVAPRLDDEKLSRQRAMFAAMKAGAEERDLAFVEAIGTSTEAGELRRRFGLPGEFQAVLVGKDGGSKLVSSDPLDSDRLFPLIDAMPMRQREMHAR